MKNFKRSISLLTIVLIILILFTLTGCSNEKTTNNNSVENSLSNDEKIDDTLEENNVVNEKVEDLKVGAYTLKYGKYAGISYEYGTAGNDAGTVSTFTNTYILNQDGTYSYFSTSGATDSGTYKVIDLSSVDAYFNGQFGIEFSNGGMLAVPANNTLQVLAGAMEKFIYQDDDNNTAAKKENNSNTSITES